MADKAVNVRVAVRCRPLNATEVQDSREMCARLPAGIGAGRNGLPPGLALLLSGRCVAMDLPRGTIVVNNPKGSGGSHEKSQTFTFDSIYDASCTQRGIYDDSVRPIVDAVIDGYNGTVFAYGQVRSASPLAEKARLFD